MTLVQVDEFVEKYHHLVAKVITIPSLVRCPHNCHQPKESLNELVRLAGRVRRKHALVRLLLL